VAYWITDADPTDVLFQRGNAFTPKRYPASDFIHPYLMREIGQTRGYPWAAASMLRLKMLADYDQAEITGSVAASRKMAFLTSGLGPNSLPAEYAGEGTKPPGTLGAVHGKYMEAEDACVEQLPYGMDIKALDWNHPNSIYGDFTSACLRGVACGLSVSYPNLANDYASVNFSSGRMARLEEIETWKFLQACVSSDFNEPVFGAWLEMSLLSGAISYQRGSLEIILPASKLVKFNQPRFYGRRWQWLDPTKEVDAIEKMLKLKLTTREKVLAEIPGAEDFVEILDQLEREKIEAAARGITLPEDAEQQAALAAANMDAENAAETAAPDEEAEPVAP
jgi:lambda family phage portal protein